MASGLAVISRKIAAQLGSTLYNLFASDPLILLRSRFARRYQFTVKNDGYATLYDVAIKDPILVTGAVQSYVPEAKARYTT